jgi:predicted  nucleic acid-binding Zn-ribbon protein
LLASYKRIRGAAKNGLAVVPIEREASAGSYIKIPPQRQIDIAQRKRIIVDEHSGRILVDKELAEEETSRMDTQIGKALTKAKK